MKKRNLKILIVSSKVGVGKSTIFMQLIAPFLYKQNGVNPVSFYEYDYENASITYCEDIIKAEFEKLKFILESKDDKQTT